ncbi:MAG: DUF177 domain-containing protein [bacterium]
MIILHLSALDKVSTQEFEWELTPEELGEGGDESLLIKAIFEVNAMKNRQYDFKGKLYFNIQLICDRCLESFSRLIEENIHFILKKEYEGDELDIIRFNDLTCDVTEYIRDIVLTSIPMKRLCRDDCRGLCDKCGKNLNKGACNCKKQEE